MPLATTPEKAGPALRRRVIWFDRLLRDGKPHRKAEMAGRFNVSVPCCSQTISFMQKQLELPLEYDPREGGFRYEKIPPPIAVSHPAFATTQVDLAALRLATALAHRYLDEEAARSLMRLHESLEEAAGPPHVRSVEKWFKEVVFTGPPPLRSPYLRHIKSAIERQRALSITYLAEGDEVVDREIEPHFLINAAGDWLVVAWDREKRGARTFALARFQDEPVALDGFERRQELDPETFTRNQFLSEGGKEPYDLVLRFDRQIARVARERKWHPSQEDRTAEDGRLELTLRISGRGDVLRWLSGFGGLVEVMEPQWMRRQLFETSKATAALNEASD